jgi:UPF0755 protein
MRLIGILVFGVVALCYVVFFSAPSDFPQNTVVHIRAGSSVSEVATQLKDAHAIRFTFPFVLAVRLLNTHGVQAGSYALTRAESALTLAQRFTRGTTGLDLVRVTIPEGSTNSEIAAILREGLLNFDTKDFLKEAQLHEGYLFPDTYFFLPGMPSAALIERMQQNYSEKTASLNEKIKVSGHTELEVLTMASILQKEARQPETMKMVSGILWKRIEIDMPLQVDAVFGYILDKPTFSPSFEDLEVDSPYNTYRNKGLPPGPIGNPGLDAITAALEPTSSPYLYYLTGKDGTMHYAKLFEQHVANRRFLR